MQDSNVFLQRNADQNPNAGAWHYMEYENVQLADNMSQWPVPIFTAHDMEHVLTDAEHGHEQIGECQIGQEKVGRRSHIAMNAYYDNCEGVA